MSLRFLFEPDAKLEFFEAIAWYESERAGLGREFAQEVMLALKRAGLHPELFPKVRGRARKVRLSRFRPYSIYFAVKDDVSSVIAVFHGSRNSAELHRRLQ